MDIRLKNASCQLRKGIWAGRMLAVSYRSPSNRQLLEEIQTFRRSLPQLYESLPLPQFLDSITPREADLEQRDIARLRNLVDAVAWFDRRSQFGLCLRRSLMRYHFLRRTGLPLGIHFGVRFRQDNEPPGIAGHAWNSLHGKPYYEREEDYRGFTEIYRWPEVEQAL